MECAKEGHDALPAGDIARQLDRRLDRLGAGIGQKQLPIALWRLVGRGSVGHQRNQLLAQPIIGSL